MLTNFHAFHDLFPVFYRRQGFCIIILPHHIRTFPDLLMLLLYQIGQVCSKYVMVVKYDTVSWALCGFFWLFFIFRDTNQLGRMNQEICFFLTRSAALCSVSFM